MSAAGYDPKIIEKFADQLLGKADSVRVGSAVCGGIFGVLVGAVPLTPLESVWPIPGKFGVATMLVGTLIGILVGYVIGEGRAFRYRVEAQRALFQLDIEKRVTAAVTTAVARTAAQAVQAAATAAARQPAPAPAPTAAAKPAPAPAEPASTPASTTQPLVSDASAPAPLRPPAAAAPPVSDTPLPPLSPAASA